VAAIKIKTMLVAGWITNKNPTNPEMRRKGKNPSQTSVFLSRFADASQEEM
jgi:hypothetical protein